MKKGIARKALAATLALGVGLALTACGSSGNSGGGASVTGEDYDGPKVSISFWNGWTGGAAPVLVPKLIEKFNSEHDNIEVKNVPMEWADVSKKLPLAVKDRKGPGRCGRARR